MRPASGASNRFISFAPVAERGGMRYDLAMFVPPERGSHAMIRPTNRRLILVFIPTAYGTVTLN